MTDANLIIDQIINWLQKYKEETKCKGVVLGISGGKDSTVVAMLAKTVWGDNVFGVLMPNGMQSDLEDAQEVVRKLNIQSMTIDVSATVGSVCDNVAEASMYFMEVSDKAKRNIAPRLRMTYLYSIAQTLGYHVIGAGNMSESYVGWTTKWGDNAYDLNPIGSLTCNEVVAVGKVLAAHFGLPEEYILKAPDDGRTNMADEQNFGFSYDMLDQWIRERSNVPESIVSRIEAMHFKSEHKRRPPRIPSLPFLDAPEREYLQIVEILGIKNRRCTAKENKTILSWMGMGFGVEAIQKANETVFVAVGKQSIPYTNSILEKWHHSGVHSIEEIEALEATAKKNLEAKSVPALTAESDSELESKRESELECKEPESAWTVERFLDYVHEKISPLELSENEQAKLIVLFSKYSEKNLIEAVNIGAARYIIYHTNDQPDRQSVEHFLEKLGGILYNISADPVNKAIRHLLNIGRKTYDYWNNNAAKGIMAKYCRELLKAGWSEEQLVDEIEKSIIPRMNILYSWSNWRDYIYERTEAVQATGKPE